MKYLLALFIVIALAAPLQTYAAPVRCECVRYLREILNVPIRGDAITQRPNIPLQNMDIGDVLLLKYDNIYHVALITRFDGQAILNNAIVPRYITIAESNYKPCSAGMRTIDLLDDHILGVIRPSYPHVQ